MVTITPEFWSNRMPSLGEKRVCVGFNPGGNDLVNEIKQKTAELIDLCDKESAGAGGEEKRLWALAMTHYEDAAMWGVKAATIEK